MRFLLPLLFAAQLSAQTAQLSGVINHYAAVTAFDTCTGAIQIADTTGFRVGGAILILQAQGAQIAAGNSSNYGQVLNIRSAGRYERAVIDSVAATAIFLKNRWLFPYEVAGRVQVITIPMYENAVVTDTLRARPWDGQTGGVLALEVSGTLDMQAPLWAEGAGFRGGQPFFIDNNSCSFAFPQAAYYYAAGNWRSSFKGEGVALMEAGKELGRGPQANGGGGGNDHNAGGGGGGQISDGGRGGDNEEPNPLGCDGNYPGIGGYSVLNTSGRLLFGGGGGAGHANNGLTSAGARGGGIILVRADSIGGSNPVVSANGASATTADGDGGGGGGAGGSIWLQTTKTAANLTVTANGGRGANTTNINANRCAGPGGGGSGGRLQSNLLSLAPPTGGAAGIVTNSTNGCNGGNGSAEDGETGFSQPPTNLPEGTVAFTLPVITSPPQSVSVCADSTALLVVGANAGAWMYQWQILNNGIWQNLTAGSIYNGVQNDSLFISSATPALDSSHFRVIVQDAYCTTRVSTEALLTIASPPMAGFAATVTGFSVAFVNQSDLATAYYWDFGDGSFSTAVHPEHTYAEEGIFNVTLQAINGCATLEITQTVVLLLAPTAIFVVVDSTSGCLSAEVAFQNLSSPNATVYQWTFPGGTPASSMDLQPTVTYGVSGLYTAQLIAANAVGQDTANQTFYVEVVALPVANFNYVLQPGGVVVFTNQSTAGSTYSWDFGDGSPVVTSADASHLYSQSGTYVVTLSVSNLCGSAILQQNVVVTIAGVATSLVEQITGIRVFPNPVEEQLRVDCSASGAIPLSIQMYDLTGRPLLKLQDILSAVTDISVVGWPGGAYIMVVIFEQGSVVRGVVKQL